MTSGQSLGGHLKTGQRAAPGTRIGFALAAAVEARSPPQN